MYYCNPRLCFYTLCVQPGLGMKLNLRIPWLLEKSYMFICKELKKNSVTELWYNYRYIYWFYNKINIYI